MPEMLLDRAVTTVGRGPGVDIGIDDPSVSPLHAELVRRGPYVYVADLGLSTNGTFVNGRPIGRAVISAGDVVTFGSVRARIHRVPDLTSWAAATMPAARRDAFAELTRRERDVIAALCRPASTRDPFVGPASTREIARRLFVSEAAVKQHLLRLYRKFSVPEGPDRRTRLANELLAAGLIPRAWPEEN